jgi:hypothetical protein
MKKINSVTGIKHPYTKRILSYLIGKDPLKVYIQTPKTIKRLTKGLTEAQLHVTTKERKWSIAQIVHHMSDAEFVAGYRYRMALADSGTKIQAFDEQKWERNLKYDTSNTKEKIALFITLREDHIAMLKKLSKSEWSRYGMHQERGKETIERMLQMIAGHDINHVRQIATLRSMVLKKSKK